MRIPSAKALLAAFDDRIWAPTEGFERCVIGGWGGATAEPTSLTLRTSEGEEGALEIDMRLGRELPLWIVLQSVVLRSVHSDFSRVRPRFPIELRIDRGKTSIRLEERAKRVNLYTCG